MVERPAGANPCRPKNNRLSTCMQIVRKNHILAPDGHAVHEYGQSYASLKRSRLIESVAHHAFDGNYYYTAKLYRRVSDDNGRNWTLQEPVFRADPGQPRATERGAPRHFLDPNTGLLLSFYSEWLIKPTEPQFESDTTDKSYRIYYQLSRDEGRTWEPGRQVIHRGAGHDETRWLPGVTYGLNGAYVESCAPCVLDDRTIVVGIVIVPMDERGKLCRPYGGYWYEVGFLRGRWNRDQTSLDWEIGGPLRVAPDVSSVGCCEPDLLHLGGRRLVATLRCQGHRGKGFFSSRQMSVSEDGGQTWTNPRPLCYDDGSRVWTPASYSAFLRSPRTGKAYWFANILDQPVQAQYPRYPLVMAEFDTERLCIVKKTVSEVQGLPAGAPPCANPLPTTDEECGRQYTNFGFYVDRETDEFVLTMPEMPKVSWNDFTSDCIEWRISE